mgnify:CR=1 FL=1
MHNDIRTQELINYIEDSMKKGKESFLHGWSMNDILWDIYTEWGKPAYNFSRKYIIQRCNNNEF